MTRTGISHACTVKSIIIEHLEIQYQGVRNDIQRFLLTRKLTSFFLSNVIYNLNFQILALRTLNTLSVSFLSSSHYIVSQLLLNASLR